MKNWNRRRVTDPATLTVPKWGRPLAPFPRPNNTPRTQLKRGQANSLSVRTKIMTVTLPKLAFLLEKAR